MERERVAGGEIGDRKIAWGKRWNVGRGEGERRKGGVTRSGDGSSRDGRRDRDGAGRKEERKEREMDGGMRAGKE